MAAETARGGRKRFPEIRIIATGGKRRAHVVLGVRAQVAGISGLLCGALALGYLGAGRIADPRQLAHQEKAAIRTEIANADLQDAVARLQDTLARTAGERSAVKTRLSAITGRTGALRGQLAAAEAKLQASRAAPAAPPAAHPPSVQQTLAQVQLAVHALKAESATLAARLNKAQADRANQSALTRRYQTGLVAAQREAKRLAGSR